MGGESGQPQTDYNPTGKFLSPAAKKERKPNSDTAYLEGCAPKIVLYVQILFYGIPIIMFVR